MRNFEICLMELELWLTLPLNLLAQFSYAGVRHKDQAVCRCFNFTLQND